MNHPIASVAALRRALPPGTKVLLINHVIGRLDRLTTVHPHTNSRDLVTWVLDSDGDLRGSHLSWPKRADLRPDPHDPATVHIDAEGTPFVTLTINPSPEAVEAAETAYDLTGRLDVDGRVAA